VTSKVTVSTGCDEFCLHIAASIKTEGEGGITDPAGHWNKAVRQMNGANVNHGRLRDDAMGGKKSFVMIDLHRYSFPFLFKFHIHIHRVRHTVSLWLPSKAILFPPLDQRINCSAAELSNSRLHNVS
jgi:hypothetical protein